MLKKSSHVAELPLFELLDHYGSKLLEGVDLTVFKAGECAYVNFGNHSTGNRTSIVPSYVGLCELYHIIKTQGYRYIVGRISDQKMMDVYRKMGAEVLN